MPQLARAFGPCQVRDRCSGRLAFMMRDEAGQLWGRACTACVPLTPQTRARIREAL